MYIKYNLVAALAFIGVGLYFAYDALFGSGDFLSRLFGAIFIVVGSARLGLVYWAHKRERRAAEQNLEASASR